MIKKDTPQERCTTKTINRLLSILDRLLFPCTDGEQAEIERQQELINRLMDENEKLKKELRKAKKDRR